MTLLLIFVAYVANVFLNRWLNKLCLKKEYVIHVGLWFMGPLASLVFLYIVIEESKFFNWFIGKHWEQN